LTVLNVAYPLAPVRPDTAGGAEQVVAMLDRALAAAGHKSVVLACEGSEVCGTLIPTPKPTGVFTDFVSQRVQREYRRAVAAAQERYRPDVIHLHGIDFLQYLPAPGVPVVATLHLPTSWYPPAVFAIERPETWLHGVSSAQLRDCPDCDNLLPTIENGVPESLAANHIRKREFAVALGRICPEKGSDTALRAARRAGIPLLLAGQVYPYESHVRYFEEQVKPLLDGDRYRFIGAVGPRAKRRLLTAAHCVLIPSQVAETSSLVAMEAMMCGTPVIAFPMGALAEIVQDEVTGFLVDDEKEMAEAISRCATIDSARCRRIARERFSDRRTSAEYLRMYTGLARQ